MGCKQAKHYPSQKVNYTKLVQIGVIRVNMFVEILIRSNWALLLFFNSGWNGWKVVFHRGNFPSLFDWLVRSDSGRTQNWTEIGENYWLIQAISGVDPSLFGIRSTFLYSTSKGFWCYKLSDNFDHLAIMLPFCEGWHAVVAFVSNL